MSDYNFIYLLAYRVKTKTVSNRKLKERPGSLLINLINVINQSKWIMITLVNILSVSKFNIHLLT